MTNQYLKGGGKSPPPFFVFKFRFPTWIDLQKKEGIKFILFVYVIARLLTSSTGYIGRVSYPEGTIASAPNYSKPTHSHGFENVFGLWERWDSLWFFQIANDGYKGNADVAFMPIYPLAIRALHAITRMPLILCGLILSNISIVIAFFFLYQLALMDFGNAIARRTIWFQAFVPGSVFLYSAYSEATYLMFSLGAFYFSKKERWVTASTLAAASCLTRNTGVLILIPLLFELWEQYRRKRVIQLKVLLALAVIPVSFLSYLLFWYAKSGDTFAFIHAQSGWQRSSSLPWQTIWAGIQQAIQFGHVHPGGYYVLELALLLIGLGVWVFSLRKIPIGYSLFMLLNILPALCAPFPGRVLMSFVRFLAIQFPLAIALASFVRNENHDIAIKIILAGLSVLITLLFITGQYMF